MENWYWWIKKQENDEQQQVTVFSKGCSSILLGIFFTLLLFLKKPFEVKSCVRVVISATSHKMFQLLQEMWNKTTTGEGALPF